MIDSNIPNYPALPKPKAMVVVKQKPKHLPPTPLKGSKEAHEQMARVRKDKRWVKFY